MRQASILLLVLAFLVGGGLWYLFQGGSGSLSAVPVVAPAANPSPGPEAPRGALRLDPDPPTEGVERKQVPVAASEAARATAPGDMSISMASGPLVRGRVVDKAGRGLPDALVVAAGDDPFPLDYAGDADSGFARRWRTTTGADGGFTLAGPEPGGLRLGVWKAGFAPLARTGLSLAAGVGSDVGDLALETSVLLEGRVIVAGGGPVAGAELFAEPIGDDGPLRFMISGIERRPLATSAADGSFRIDMLAAGPWKLSVKSRSHPDASFEGLTERPGERLTGLELALPPGGQIAGLITGMPEDSPEGLIVRATPVGQARSFGPSADYREGAVAPDGSFVVAGCEAGEKYELQGRIASERASMPWGGEVKTRTNVVPATVGQSGVNLVWMGTTGVTFRVVTAGGTPVEDFTVKYGRGFQRPFEVDGEQVRSFPGGVVRLTELSLQRRGPGGEYLVVVEAPGYEPFERSVDLEVGRVVDAGVFQLTAGNLLGVRVVDANTGAPIAGAGVELSVAGSGASGSGLGRRGGGFMAGFGSRGELRQAESDADGLARLTSFEGQLGSLRVTAEGHTPFELEALDMPVGKPLEVEARLGLGGSVRVVVLDALGMRLAGATVLEREVELGQDSGGARPPFRAARSFGGDGQHVSDQDGVVLFEHLAPGAHEFRIAAAQGGGGMRFFVREASTEAETWTQAVVTEGGLAELELREEPRSALVGVVREAGEALVGAKLSLAPRQDAGPASMPGMLLMGALGGAGTGSSDGRGEFALTGVEPGSYTLTVGHPTRAMDYQLELELVAGENRLELDLPLASVEGRVTDSDGNPVPGVKVELLGGSSQQSPISLFIGDSQGASMQVGGGGVDPAQTDADGRYLLRGVAVDTEIQVQVSQAGSSPTRSEPFEVSDGQLKSGVDLVLEPAGEVVVQFEGQGQGMFIMVVARSLDDEGREPITQFVDQGSARLSGLFPGEWEVSVSRLGGPDEGPGIEPQRVTVHAGRTSNLTFEL